jgi:hypothetical protein
MYGEFETVRICRMIERDLQETRLRRMARQGRFAPSAPVRAYST